MADKEALANDNRTTLMLAYLCIKGVDNLTEQVAILDRFEFTSAQIATICGVAEGSVRNARMQGKKIKPGVRRKESSSIIKE
jgi:DNA-directed RNA polymerase specialized sigma24 family protein